MSQAIGQDLRASIVETVSPVPDASMAERRKLRKATQDFESILIASLWEEMHKALGVSDAEQKGGSDTLEEMSIQCAATAVAAGGGFGIARMIFHQLEGALHRKQ